VDTALTGLTRRLRRDREPQRLHRWGVATATTADGVVAEIEVGYVVRFTDQDGRVLPPDEVDMAALDAVEDRIRQQIAARTVDVLPSAGDPAGWADEVTVDGAVVEHAVVARSDVQVTPELRRLVRPTQAPPRWS
jgi:hypothetical protein